MDLGHQMLCLAEEEVSLWSPGAGPQPSSLVEANDQLVPAQCKGVVMAQLECPLTLENGLIEPSPEAHLPEGLHCQDPAPKPSEVSVSVLSATRRDQTLTKSPWHSVSQSRW
jgi:hypothetical protein